jgi:hypothetical protein
MLICTLLWPLLELSLTSSSDEEEEPTSKEGSAPDGNNGSNGNGHNSNGSKDAGNGTSRWDTIARTPAICKPVQEAERVSPGHWLLPPDVTDVQWPCSLTLLA